MATLMVSKKKQIMCMLENVRSLLNVISLLHVVLYLLLGKHYKDHVLKSEFYFTHGLGATTPIAEEEAIEADATNEFNASTQFDDGGLDGIKVSSTQPQPSPPGMSQKKRKRIDGWTHGMFEVSSSIKKLVNETMVYLDKISNVMSEESTMKKQVANELQKIPGLTLTEVLDAGKDISSDSYMATVFFNLPNDKRKDMVFEVLKRRNNMG